MLDLARQIIAATGILVITGPIRLVRVGAQCATVNGKSSPAQRQ